MRLLERYESVSGKRLRRDARGGWSVKHLGKPLFGRASNHDLYCRPLLLRPEGCSILLLEHEGAAGVDRVGIENALVRLARDCAGLATLSHDETNDVSARPGRSGRARRSGGAKRSLIALFVLGGDLLLGSRKRQERRQQQNKEPANLHAASLDIRLISGHEIRTASCSLKRAARRRRERRPGCATGFEMASVLFEQSNYTAVKMLGHYSAQSASQHSCARALRIALFASS